MTPEELLAIEARANAATPGKWQVGDSEYIINVDGNWICETHVSGDPDLSANADNDAIFIAAARSDVPALVARVKELEARNAIVEDFLRRSMPLHKRIAELEAALNLSHEVNVKHEVVCGEAIDQRDEAEARLAIALEKIRGETKEP